MPGFDMTGVHSHNRVRHSLSETAPAIHLLLPPRMLLEPLRQTVCDQIILQCSWVE